jgi:tetratricopeptide (TPR) repeat protein
VKQQLKKTAAILFMTTVIGFQSVSAETLKLEKSQPVKVDYEFAQWNKNPNLIDSAVVIFRDAQSGKLAKIALEENGPNTGIFTGYFTISFVGEGEVIPEFYLPPQAKQGLKASEEYSTMIKEGRLARKPYFLRKEEGQQLLSVYNSKEQAMDAFNKFRVKLASPPTIPSSANPTIAIPLKPKPVVDQFAIDAQRAAEIAAEKERVAKLVFAQEMMRTQLAEEEKRKKEEMIKQQNQLAAEEKNKRIEQAKTLAAAALVLFKQEQFKPAEEKFRQSIELDPANQSYYFQYGVTLYKNEKHNESIVALDQATDSSVNATEKAYFKGLNYLKLKEFDKGLTEFSIVKNSEGKTMPSLGAFFKGVLFFNQEKYTEAKAEFQFTLDKSEDPKLDAQADTYIEQIANIEQFEEKKKHRFTADITFGMQYDSNVLLVSDSSGSSATTTDKAGLRGMLIASLDYRAIITEINQWDFNLSYTDMYTYNTSFKASADLQKADPMLIDFKIPYKHMGKLFGKGYQLTISPGYETMNINADGEGARELSLVSSMLSTSQTFIVSDSYFTTLDIEYRTDDSKGAEPSATDADDTKITVATKNVWFQDQKKTRAWLGNFTYTLNNAKGDDYKFNKIELAGGYLMPVMKDGSLSSLLSYFSTKYPSHSQSRTDSGLNLTLGLSKPVSEKLTGSYSATYNLNNSNVDTSKYNKFTFAALLNYAVDF